MVHNISPRMIIHVLIGLFFISDGFLMASSAISWNAAQGVRCEFEDSRTRCMRASWGFEIQTLDDLQLEDYPHLKTLRDKLQAIRPDQELILLSTRWINRTDRAMFLEPSNIWLKLENQNPYRPMTLEEIAGLWGDLQVLDQEPGQWLQKNIGLTTIYIPPKHYTDKILIFRVPRRGWVRLELEVDPIWVGTELNRFRIWGQKKVNSSQGGEPPEDEIR